MKTEEAADYRGKYRSLLEEVDSKEKEWEVLDQSIRRTLGHLVIIAQGPVLPALAKHLEKIRDALKAGANLVEVEKEVDEIRKQIMTEDKRMARSAELPPVHEVIIRIIERLPVPLELSGKAHEIIRELEGGVEPEKLPGAVAAVASLMHGLRSRMAEDKRQLEVLLEEVSRKLAEMEKGVAATHKSAMAGFASNRTLDEKVSAEVKGIEDKAETATDLTGFRKSLTSSLDAIRGHLESKRKEDSQRESSLQDEVNKLREHVGSLENEVKTEQEKVKKAIEVSHRDPLTGCLNRQAYEERGHAEHARARRYGHPMSMAIFDLDKFKNINDSFGHPAGDQVLKAVSMIAAKQLREMDVFCRFGGEEFVGIFPETPIKGAEAAAEKVRKAVEDFHFHSRGDRVVITISGGVAELKAGESFEDLLKRADDALYKAKKGGRNRCEVAR